MVPSVILVYQVWNKLEIYVYAKTKNKNSIILQYLVKVLINNYNLFIESKKLYKIDAIKPNLQSDIQYPL